MNNEEGKQDNGQKLDKSRTILWIIVFLFAISISIYYAGVRIDEKTLKITLPASINMHLTETDAVVIINNTPVKKTGENKEIKLGFIPAGNQEIGVAKEGFWPWIKTVTLESGQNIKLEPILISKNPTGEIILPEDGMHNFVLESIKAGKNKTATSSDGNILLTIDNNRAKAIFQNKDWSLAPEPFCAKDEKKKSIESTCEAEIIIFSAKEGIRNIGFYKNRNDIAIIAISNGIFALEISGNETHTFQPLYKGKMPFFVIGNDNKLYVADEGAVMLINW